MFKILVEISSYPCESLLWFLVSGFWWPRKWVFVLDSRP